MSPEEVGRAEPSDLVVGLTGRGKRDQDARELEIIHVENERGKPTAGDKVAFLCF